MLTLELLSPHGRPLAGHVVTATFSSSADGVLPLRAVDLFNSIVGQAALFSQIDSRRLGHQTSELSKLGVHLFHLLFQMTLIDRAHFLRVFRLQ